MFNIQFKNISKKTNWILLLVNLLFVIYFILLSVYNRLSQDDYLFLKYVENNGILSFVSEAYLTQSGRFIGYFYNSILYYLISKTGFVFFVPILTWCISFLILFYILSEFFNNTRILFKINLTALILNIFVITNFEFTAFFWVCAGFVYIIPILGLLLIVLVVKDSISNFQYFLLIIISIVLSGSSEIFVPFCLLFLMLLYFWHLNKKSDTLNIDKKAKRIIITFSILLFGLIVILLAPGNYIRASESIFQKPESLIDFILISAKSFVLFFYLLGFKFPYFLILILISFFLGYQNKTQIFFSKLKYEKFLFISWLGYFSFVGLSVLPAAYLMSGFGFQRIYTTTVFFSVIFFVIQGFVFGLKIKSTINLYYVHSTIIVTSFILVLVMSANLYFDIPTARSYSMSDKKRINYLIELREQGHRSLVELEPLDIPYTFNLKYLILQKNQPVLYYSNEISKDTSGYENECIKHYYDLSFPIKLKSD